MKKRHIITLVFLFSLAIQTQAVDLPQTIENTIYVDHIKTVEMYRSGWKLSHPIITLNSDQQLTFSFDDLTQQTQDYRYTIYHCDQNWNRSKIGQHEYLESFYDFPITDFQYSSNTHTDYINYMLSLPNEDVPLILSGNYALIIFDQDQPDQPLITWRFYVIEPKTTIQAQIRRATHDSQHGENQEIDFTIEYNNLKLQDPQNNIRVVVTQNNRNDNALTQLKPRFFDNKSLDYNYDIENNFKGENEFRAFDIRRIKHLGKGVEALNFIPPTYHAFLFPNQLRTQDRYSYYKEMNGNYYIEAYTTDKPETEADYFFVHFSLHLNQLLIGGNIYVFGKLSNWQCLEQNKMKWNFEKNQYELTLLLKQGYYNFTYAYQDQIAKIIKCYNLEGSHCETENDYQIYVYYKRRTDRYEHLIGYEKFNSNLNKSY